MAHKAGSLVNSLLKLTFFVIPILLVHVTMPLQAKTLVVGVEKLHSPPLQWIEEGELRGYYRDLLDNFATKNGYTIEYEALPVDELYQALLEGSVDFKLPDNPSWMSAVKNKVKVCYSSPVLNYIEGVMVKPSNLLKEIKLISSDIMVDNKRIFDPNKVTTFNTPELETAIRMVLKSRTDGVYTNIQTAKYLMDNHIKQPNSLVFDDRQPHHSGSYYMSTVNRSEVLKEFDDYLVEHSQKVKEIKAKYYSTALGD